MSVCLFVRVSVLCVRVHVTVSESVTVWLSVSRCLCVSLLLMSLSLCVYVCYASMCACVSVKTTCLLQRKHCFQCATQHMETTHILGQTIHGLQRNGKYRCRCRGSTVFSVHRMGLRGLGLGLTDRFNQRGRFLQHPAAAACSTAGRGAAANYKPMQ